MCTTTRRLTSASEAIGAALDYPAYFYLTAGFVSSNGNLSIFASVVQAGQSAYTNAEHYMGSFLENHDNPRFQSLTQDQAVCCCWYLFLDIIDVPPSWSRTP